MKIFLKPEDFLNGKISQKFIQQLVKRIRKEGTDQLLIKVEVVQITEAKRITEIPTATENT